MEQLLPQQRQWINPSQVMNMRRAKKRRKSGVCGEVHSPVTAVQKENVSSGVGKRRDQAEKGLAKVSPFQERVVKTRDDSSPLVKV